ncbi:MAG: hypothetical protein HQM02_02685 [Magnetococcales bacterium]|nr:hypothetical protein [Magnetococcales bacterium]
MAGVAAVGASFAKMQVSGMDVSAEYTGGNKSFNVAETAFQVGLKQFKDAECDPAAVIGAAPEGADGSTIVTQAMGEMGSFKLTFCPLGEACFPDSLMPTDTDVEQGREDNDDGPETKNPYWHNKYGKHGKWLEWLSRNHHFQYHHNRHSDKWHHWKDARNHLKHCHGPHHRHHNNRDPKCDFDGETGVEDPVSLWMVTAVDSSSGNQRTLIQTVSCDPGDMVGGNLFTGVNYAAWPNHKGLINKSTGTVDFDEGGGDETVRADGDELLLPEDGGQDVWFRGTFKLPAVAGSSLEFEFKVKNDGYRKQGRGTRTIQCGDTMDIGDGITLTRNSTTIRCASHGTSASIKCDGTVDADCNISAGKLHFNLGKMDTDKVKEIEIKGQRTELYNAFVGARNDGVPAQAKAKLEIGTWGEKL